MLSECNGCRRDSRRMPTCQRCAGTGCEPAPRRVELWMCPDCPSYYGASSAGDLAAIVNVGREGPTHARDRCPDCAASRLLVKTVVLVPQSEVAHV